MRACSGVLLALLLGTTSLSACSGTVAADDVRGVESVLPGLTVSGAFRARPEVRMKAPLRIEETTSTVTITGTGAPLVADQLFVVELSLYDARTGEAAVLEQPVAAKSSDNTLFPVLDDALVGARQGSRVVVAATPADAFASGGVPPHGIRKADGVVVVADLVAVPPVEVLDTPEDRPARNRPGQPGLVVSEGLPVGVDVHGLTEPDEVQVYPLLAGTGAPVAVPGLVTLDVLGQKWGSEAPFEDTFFKEPALFALGTGSAPPSWDHALTGVRRGSRILIVDPGDPRGTMLWVVDVLGVS